MLFKINWLQSNNFSLNFILLRWPKYIYLAWTIGNGYLMHKIYVYITQYTTRKGEARGESSHENNNNRLVETHEE